MKAENTINELGEKTPHCSYTCKVCRKNVDIDKVREEEWFFQIKNSSTTEPGVMNYFSENEVDYICNEHYNTLDDNEIQNFAPVGYPYFASVILNDSQIFSF